MVRRTRSGSERESLLARAASDRALMLGYFSYFNRDATNIRNVPEHVARRPHGHRLLPRPHVAVHFRRGTAPGHRCDRTRPGFRCGSFDVDAARASIRARCGHL